MRRLALGLLIACAYAAHARAGSFGPPRLVTSPGGGAVAVGSDGTAVVFWSEAASTFDDPVYFAAIGRVDGALASKQRMPGPGHYAAGAGGLAAVGLYVDKGAAMAWGTAGAGFGAPTVVDASPVDDAPDVAVTGRWALVTWMPADRSAVFATWCSHLIGSCLPAKRLGAQVSDVQAGMHVAMGVTPTEGLVMWGGAGGALMLATLPLGSTAGTVKQLNPGGPAAGGPLRIATDTAGRAVLTWGPPAPRMIGDPIPPDLTRAVVRAADGSFSRVRDLPWWSFGTQPVIRRGFPPLLLGSPRCEPFNCPTVAELPSGPTRPLRGFASYGHPGSLGEGAGIDGRGLLVWAPGPTTHRAWIGRRDGTAGREEVFPTTGTQPLGVGFLGLDDAGTGLFVGNGDNRLAPGDVVAVPYRSSAAGLHGDPPNRVELIALAADRLRYRLQGTARVRFTLSGRGGPMTWQAVGEPGVHTVRLPTRVRARLTQATAVSAVPFDHLGAAGPRVRRTVESLR